MSEFQQYEWQAVDRPLSTAEQHAVNALSSHITVSPAHALVTYDWGAFKHDAIDVLEQYFDAFLYYANWGSRQLAFRFPHGTVEAAALAPYLDDEFVTFTSGTDYDILNMDWQAMEPGDYEMAALLGPLVGLRREIQQGDLRGLYIAWMGTQKLTAWKDTPDAPWHEPPLPPGLASPTAAQQALIALLELDPFLIQAAGEGSAPLAEYQDDFAAWVPLLPAAEQRDYLVRLARGEVGLDLRLAHRLRALGQAPDPTPPATPPAPRTLSALQKRATVLQREHDQAEKERIRREHIARLESLVGQEDRLWHAVHELLAKPGSARYDNAVAQIITLRDLARHQHQMPIFMERLQDLVQQYQKRTSFMQRLREQRLV